MAKRALSAVPVVAGIDLDFRPRSYLADTDPLSAIVQNIKGQNRRDMARAFIAGDAAKQFGEIEDGLLQDSLDDALRDSLSAIHPSYLGGEFLPNYRKREVEIARVVLESVTRDVISLRAATNANGTRIRYRMVDEYEAEYGLSPESSSRPLSLRELVALMDAVEPDFDNPYDLPLVETFAADSFLHSGSPEEAARFVDVESSVYPELGNYYRARLDAWAAEEQRKLDLDDQDDADEAEEDTKLFDELDESGGIIITGWQPRWEHGKDPEPPAAPGV